MKRRNSFAPHLPKPALLPLLVLLALPPCTSQAGFLQEFYDDASLQSSYTAPGLYASASMDTVTGGRFILKANREDFHPYYLQGPELKAGCGEPGSDKIPTEAVVYKCDEKDKCLNPTRTTYSDVNLNNQIYKAMTNYRSSLVYRDVSRVTAEEMTMLATISSLPLLKLAELAASPRMINFSDGMLQTFAQVAAYEAILTAVGQLTEDAKSVVSSSSAKSANSQATEYAQTLVARCDVLRAELLSREKVMSSRVSQVSSLLSYISHLQRTIYGDSAIEALSTMPGSGISQ